MVERRDCRLLTGITLSSEALAVVPKLAEWDSIFISSDNGDGRLTAESLVPNFFRANISGPMGTRAVSLYLRSAKLKNFYALGHRLRLGPQQRAGVRARGEASPRRSSSARCSRRPAPRTTRPTSPRSASPAPTPSSWCMQGDDNNAFLSQAQQYRLPEKVKLLTEIVDLASIRAVGDASLGLIGSSRYSFTYDHPANKEFVALWKKEHGTVPDTFEGEQWQCMKVFEAGITRPAASRPTSCARRSRTSTIESVKGKVHDRASAITRACSRASWSRWSRRRASTRRSPR